MRIVNNFGGRFGWLVVAGIGTFVLCAVGGMLITICFGMSTTGDAPIVGRFPPPPLDGVPFRGSQLLYYLSAGLVYLAIAGLGLAFVGMALSPRRSRQ